LSGDHLSTPEVAWPARVIYFERQEEGSVVLKARGITLHSLRSAAISPYAASGLTMLETADVMGQSDPHVTWKHYARLFDPTKVAERVRAAQESIELGGRAA
jgi:hypothetical protein